MYRIIYPQRTPAADEHPARSKGGSPWNVVVRAGLLALLGGTLLFTGGAPAASAAPTPPVTSKEPGGVPPSAAIYCLTHLCITNLKATASDGPYGKAKVVVTFNTSLPATSGAEVAHVFAFDPDGTFDDPDYSLGSSTAKTSHSYTFYLDHNKVWYYLAEAKHTLSGAEVIKTGQITTP